MVFVVDGGRRSFVNGLCSRGGVVVVRGMGRGFGVMCRQEAYVGFDQF